MQLKKLTEPKLPNQNYWSKQSTPGSVVPLAMFWKKTPLTGTKIPDIWCCMQRCRSGQRQKWSPVKTRICTFIRIRILQEGSTWLSRYQKPRLSSPTLSLTTRTTRCTKFYFISTLARHIHIFDNVVHLVPRDPPPKEIYPLNLIFWIVMGCGGTARFGPRDLKNT